ncbi:DoxX-like family protein [Aliikangiella sp. IMCC44359]|uniref:DoxX-like family protein n=1 Tax=Aliikangiella sp. IMCC44359 TaxID=3459125 RepID=UPI00403B0C28
MNGRLKKVNLISRLAVAFVFFYHGLVPKLLYLNSIELAMVKAHQLPVPAFWISYTAGIIEIILAILITFKNTWLLPVYIAAGILLVLLIDVAIFMPELLTGAFNPVSTNLAAIALCYFIYLSQPAVRCAHKNG